MYINQDEDEDDFAPRPFEHGRWEWSNNAMQLIFIKKTAYTKENNLKAGLTPQSIRNMEFKLEIDLIDEHWFKKHYQRPFDDNDVVKLQDVKDVVFFMAPRTILTHNNISVLHLNSMDRFLRALIFYCQYYLQVSSEVAERCLQLQYKIKTLRSQQIEDAYQKNLIDLRILLAKEYCGLVLGGEEYCKYHHMDKTKTYSLTGKDGILFESIIRISTYIVWIALGRKSFQKIELEIQRLLKPKTYNVNKNHLKCTFEKELSSFDYAILFGSCDQKGKTMTKRSPLINEMTCDKNKIDYRLLGIGAMEYPTLNARLLYFQSILSSPETKLEDLGLSLGIIGLSRERFDTLLREIKKPTAASSISVKKISSRYQFRKSSSARSSAQKINKYAFEMSKLYQDIHLPEKRDEISVELLESFPDKALPINTARNQQRLKWLRFAAVTKKRNIRNKLILKTIS